MPCTSDVASLRFSSSGMRGAWSRTISVVIARGIHLFPFRTEQLSLSAPMVLGLQGPGRVGRRRLIAFGPSLGAALLRCSFAWGGRVLSAFATPFFRAVPLGCFVGVLRRRPLAGSTKAL